MPELIAQLEAALDALHEGIQILSPEWRYLYVNDAAAEHGRKTREELVGRTMQECYPGIDRSPMFESLDACRREQRAAVLENEFAYADGGSRWFELRVRPFRGGLVVASLDITERKAVEHRLQEAYRQALRDLVLPIIRVHEGVLLVPLVGALDHHRVDQMSEDVVERVARDCAKVVIFDVAGVPSVDTAVANQLLQTTPMIRLLGASAILTGLAPAVARTLVQLGVDLSTMETRHQLSDGISLALGKVR